jgi:large conductance mechanosensitive channel
MLRDFKTFVLRGNVVDLAIGVAIGAAFGTVIAAFTDGLITPLLALPGESASVSDHVFEISDSVFRYGMVIDAVIGFIITAAVLFFAVMLPVNKLMDRRKTEPAPVSTTKQCPECLSSIPVAARRCAFCTSAVSV